MADVVTHTDKQSKKNDWQNTSTLGSCKRSGKCEM